MGFFSTILEKLGLKKDKTEEAAAPAAPAAAAPKAEPAKPSVAPAKPLASAAARPMKDDRDLVEKPAAPVAVSEVDVVAKLEKLAAENSAQLNWKVSIVDLLKLLDIDSSGAARKELAEELGCPADQMSDSARMNVWLHKEVLKKIAENGGNIPADLLN